MLRGRVPFNVFFAGACSACEDRYPAQSIIVPSEPIVDLAGSGFLKSMEQCRILWKSRTIQGPVRN